MSQKISVLLCVLLLIITGCAHGPSGGDKQTGSETEYRRAQELMEKEDFDGVITLCKSIVASDGFFGDAYEILVDAYVKKGKEDESAINEAEEYLKKLSMENPHSIEPPLGLCLLFLKLNKYEEAISICDELLKDNPENIRIFKLLGSIYYDMGNSIKAMEVYKTVLLLGEKSGDKKSKLIALVRIGSSYERLGEYLNAIEFSEQALLLARELGDNFYISRCLNDLGIVYQFLSDTSKALEYYEQALLLNRKLGEKLEEAKTLGNIGMIYMKLKDYPESLEYYTKSLSMARELGNLTSEAINLGNLGILYGYMSEDLKALESYEKALPIARKVKNKPLEGFVLHNLATAYRKKFDYPRAIECYEKALLLNIESGYIRGERYSLWALGNVYFAIEEYSRALSYFEKAIQMTEETRAALLYEEFKTSFLHGETKAYENVINLLYTMNNQYPGQGYDARAFRYAEKSMARGLLDLMAESEADINQTIDPELLKLDRQIDKEFSRVNTELQQQLILPEDKIDNEKVRTLREELKALNEQYEQLKKNIMRSNPRFGEVRYFEALSVKEIQRKLLDNKTVLLEFKISEEALFAWRITKEGSSFFKLPIPEDELGKKVSALRNCFTIPVEEKFFAERAWQLYEDLMVPLLKGIEQKEKLLIIPDGILNYLPFEVLITKPIPDTAIAAYKDLPYLLKEFSVRYAPSATIAGGSFNRENKKDKDILALGDPLFEKELVMSSNSPVRDIMVTDINFGFDRLANSGDEVVNIGRLFDKANIFTREEASEEKIKGPESLEGYRYIHLAAHGILNEKDPQFSGIVLAQDNDPAEDGFLFTREIFNLKLNADLVVLSACHTGQGKLVKGEGIVGLTRAWMYAGASSVLVSLWGVDDLSTRYLMEVFYRNLRDNMEFTAALRAAKLEVLNMDVKDDSGTLSGKSYGSPFYWAGFILTGRL